jgi:eukaryotic-like serine/threonine-protein kinase
MIGRTVGKYRIIDRLGRGGMGTVYKAVDETLDREVAIKVLNPDLTDSELLKRFRAEAVTLARLNHPGIATLYELHRQEDDLLMVMEFVRGETFHDLSERLGPLAPPQAAHLCMQVLDALAHAHRAGVVHRDLKPANLMVSETGAVKVMDFGIARVLGTEHFTHGGYMMGTPAYMAPEQVMGREVDARADLYAIGVVLYRLLSGQLPFEADTAIAMVQKQISDPPTPISTFCPDLPSWCATILERALQKSPTERFQSAEEFRAALRNAVQPQTLGEMPTFVTPTPPGLLVDPDLTMAHDFSPPTGTSVPSWPTSGRQRRTTAAAVATPPTQVRTLASAQPMSAMTSTATPSLEKTTGGTAVVLGRSHLAAMAAVIVLLLAGIGVLGFAALRRNTAMQQVPYLGADPQQASASAPAPTGDGTPAAPVPATSSSTAVAPNAQAPAGPLPPTGRDVAATAGAGAVAPAAGTGVTPGRGTVPPGTSPTDAAGRAGRGTVPAKDSSTTPPPATPAASAAVVSFDNIRVLVVDSENKGREREAVLQLGGGRLSIVAGDKGPSIASLPYANIRGAFYSRSKQPKWKDDQGKEVESKVDLGRMGFLRGDRNWLILLTPSEPLIFRVDDSQLKAVVPVIQEQTGVAIRR